MRRALVVLALLFTCSPMVGRSPSARSDKGEVLWFPDRFEGWKIASVTRLYGSNRIEVYVNPKHCYQYAATMGESQSGAVVIDTRYYEIDTEPRKDAPQPPGWRSLPSPSIHAYPVREFTATIPATKTTAFARVDVYFNGANYLLELTTFRDKDVEVSLPRVSALEPHK